MFVSACLCLWRCFMFIVCVTVCLRLWRCLGVCSVFVSLGGGISASYVRINVCVFVLHVLKRFNISSLCLHMTLQICVDAWERVGVCTLGMCTFVYVFIALHFCIVFSLYLLFFSYFFIFTILF